MNDEVKKIHCPARYTTYRDEFRQERHERWTHHERVARCRTRPMPHPHVTVEDVEEEEGDMFTHNDLLELQEDPEEECLEKGDRIYTIDLAPQCKGNPRSTPTSGVSAHPRAGLYCMYIVLAFPLFMYYIY